MMNILKEATFGSINSVYSIAIIIIPIMITLQILKDYKVLDKITKPFNFLARIFKTSNETVLPLLVGILFGLSYGAGVIIQSAKEGNLNKRDLTLITIFLVSCHAVFEDTLIFVAVGANGYILLITRLIAAFILTYIFSKKLPAAELQEIRQENLS
ncbi:nucleoside recognition protein [Alkaliphilus pronyensis]|uniref:Nucleoside recognition protein n=1 Tax=Alkaliphilus pronyensis TaxID=1482732 RepID=A0A6I0F3U5_9FIRM|nr:nucleoside recognition domain-containing protein [Alkaliphilus pronyensis]KAB3536032.1 nucleoside recognition protein [Alkaliphilus pronyensis]